MAIIDLEKILMKFMGFRMYDSETLIFENLQLTIENEKTKIQKL